MALAKFGQTVRGRKNTEYADGQMPLAASQYLRDDGGRFVTLDQSSGYFSLSDANSTQLDGWVHTCKAVSHNQVTQSASTPFIGSATGGVSVVEGTRNIHTEDDAVWMPSADTLTAAYKGLKCDLIVTGSTTTTKQLVKPTVTTNKVVQILDVDVTNQLALVYAIK